MKENERKRTEMNQIKGKGKKRINKQREGTTWKGKRMKRTARQGQ
jgi:hypothetical protein